MKESRCRWGEAPWKRVGGEQRRELLLRSSTGSFAFDAELPSPPLPPFPPSFIEHMWKPGGEIPSSLGTDLNNIFHLFFYILTFTSFEASDGVFQLFFWYFHFRNFESELGGASGLEGLTRPKPRSPLGHLSPELMSAIQLTETKTSLEPINRNFFCATKCRSILKFSLVSPFSFSSWSPVVSSS